MPIDDRSSIRKIMEDAGEETVKSITRRLIDAGLSHATDVLSLFKA